MKRDTSKDTLIIIKSVETSGFSGDLADLYVPPLGTLKSVSIGDRTLEGGITLDNTPVMGGFELIVGKTALSWKNESDKQDTQDLQHEKDFVRGWGSYSGSLELDNPRGNERFIGAILGLWDPDNKLYSAHKDFRYFEVWVLKGVDHMGLDVTSARVLIKHYMCILESGDEKFENPIKISVPITSRYMTRHVNWTAPLASQDVVAANAYSAGEIAIGIVQPREHTRLNFNVTVQTTPGTMIITGRNIVGETITETVTIAGTTSAEGEKLSREYFAAITDIRSGTFVGTLAVTDFDYKIR
jgi:hypothetical protein